MSLHCYILSCSDAKALQMCRLWKIQIETQSPNKDSVILKEYVEKTIGHSTNEDDVICSKCRSVFTDIFQIVVTTQLIRPIRRILSWYPPCKAYNRTPKFHSINSIFSHKKPNSALYPFRQKRNDVRLRTTPFGLQSHWSWNICPWI